jgi:hypothetical protein
MYFHCNFTQHLELILMITQFKMCYDSAIGNSYTKKSDLKNHGIMKDVRKFKKVYPDFF